MELAHCVRIRLVCGTSPVCESYVLGQKGTQHTYAVYAYMCTFDQFDDVFKKFLIKI